MTNGVFHLEEYCDLENTLEARSDIKSTSRKEIIFEHRRNFRKRKRITINQKIGGSKG